jgi:hypothetical protein
MLQTRQSPFDLWCQFASLETELDETLRDFFRDDTVTSKDGRRGSRPRPAHAEASESAVDGTM